MSRGREKYEDIAKKIKRDTDELSEIGRSHMFGPPGLGGILNSVTPCAACKLLRRRCAHECPFSPYFPPNEPQKFASVHKIFGASNVSKILMEVPERQRADAANSLVYEANVRLNDPVYGCMGLISALHQQVEALQTEVNAVKSEIMKYKYREANVILLSSGAISISASSPSPTLLPPLPSLPALPSSTVSSPVYPQSSAMDFSTISNENISYFG